MGHEQAGQRGPLPPLRVAAGVAGRHARPARRIAAGCRTKQVLFEEAAVLAGTMLMGSGVSGNRPDAHDSTVTLATLVQQIAVYRDAFYEQLLRS